MQLKQNFVCYAFTYEVNFVKQIEQGWLKSPFYILVSVIKQEIKNGSFSMTFAWATDSDTAENETAMIDAKIFRKRRSSSIL